MRLIPSDPDVETIVRRIADGSLDLQPEFQRGAVWSKPKQRLLIDSILREWYVPPVHVVRTNDDSQVVLDGQQRLNAIYEFVQRRFTVDGSAEPASDDVKPLDGLYYDQLPPQARRRFDRFTVRQFEVVDYSAEEPFELFYRLNQPTPLTSAEKRNAFFGPARAQIRELTDLAEASGMSPDRVGFSNARLAYEDVVARFVWTLEAMALDEKVTANRITERYRDSRPFDVGTTAIAESTLKEFFSLQALDHPKLRFNKAMLHSWLCFVARAHIRGEKVAELEQLVADVEFGRQAVKGQTRRDRATTDLDVLEVGFAILNDRATSRVNDVSSVMLRDIMLWSIYDSWFLTGLSEPEQFMRLLSSTASVRDGEEALLAHAADTAWSSFT